MGDLPFVTSLGARQRQGKIPYHLIVMGQVCTASNRHHFLPQKKSLAGMITRRLVLLHFRSTYGVLASNRATAWCISEGRNGRTARRQGGRQGRQALRARSARACKGSLPLWKNERRPLHGEQHCKGWHDGVHTPGTLLSSVKRQAPRREPNTATETVKKSAHQRQYPRGSTSKVLRKERDESKNR